MADDVPPLSCDQKWIDPGGAVFRNLRVHRYELPNLLALNFVVVGLLGEGVSSSTRIDPQAKGLGERLRARVVDLPVELLESQGG